MKKLQRWTAFQLLYAAWPKDSVGSIAPSVAELTEEFERRQNHGRTILSYMSAWVRRSRGIDHEEPPRLLNACHGCAMREVGIWDNGSEYSEEYLGKRRMAYHTEQDRQGHRPPQPELLR